MPLPGGTPAKTGEESPNTRKRVASNRGWSPVGQLFIQQDKGKCHRDVNYPVR
jgi:hypothetical protein